MRMTPRIIVGVVWACLALSCTPSAPAPQVLGQGETLTTLKARAMTVEAMKAASVDTEVVVSGRVCKVCPAGCWFYLHGEGDLVYVDVAGDFSVPDDATGQGALVRAWTEGEGGSRTLRASQVVLAP